MASNTLKITQNFGNKYERARALYSGNEWFNEEDWINHSRSATSDLDMYIQMLNESDKIQDKDKFVNDYNFSYADSDTRVAALYNELYADRTNVDTERQRYVGDDSNGNAIYEKFKASDYEYYKSVIKNKNDLNYQKYLEQQEQERKDSMSGFAKFMSTLAAIPLDMLSGAASVVDGMIDTFSAIAAGVDSAIKTGNFSDAYVSAISDDDWRPFDDFQEWVVDFESRYTHLRDLNGNYTGVGNYIGQISTTIGQMLPSIFISKVGGKIGVKVGGKVGSTITKGSSISSQIVYYQSMNSNNIRDMYNQFAANDVTVSSAAIIGNAALKSTLEFGIERILGELMGGSALDNIVFGRSASKNIGKTSTASLTKSGISRLLKDMHQEGLEEVLQETSGFLTDYAFTSITKENFGENTELTWQTLMDTYLIAAIVSFAMSSTDILTTSGKEMRKLGKGGKIAAWEYGFSLQSFVENYNKIIKEDKKAREAFKNAKDLDKVDKQIEASTKKSSAAMAKMYASYRILSSIYGEIGEQRFNAANKVLEEINKGIKEGKYDLNKTVQAAKSIYKSIFGQSDTLEERFIEDANITALVDNVTRDDVDISESLSDEEIDAVKKIFEADKDIDNVVVTKDGNKPLKIKNKILIPERLLKNADASVTLYSIAEQEIVNSISKMTLPKVKISLDNVLDTFKKLTGRTDATIEDAIYSLVLDENAGLFNALLVTANRDVIDLLLGLTNVMKNYSVKDLKDALYKKKLESIVSKMKSSLTSYLILQQNVKESDYAHVLDDKQISRIRRERWSKNIYNKVVLGEKLTDTDEKVLYNRVLYSNLPETNKKTILENVKSSKPELRVAAMNALDIAYDRTFTTDYDGKTYMPMTNIPNIVFNTYLQNIGKTLSTLLNSELSEEDIRFIQEEYTVVNPQTILKYRSKQFSDSCNGLYSFVQDNKGNWSVIENKSGKRTGFSYYQKNVNSILTADSDVDRSFLFSTVPETAKNFLSIIVNDDVPEVTRSMLTITDVINDSSLLNDDVLKEIYDKYKIVNPETTFIYLRNMLVELNENFSIVANPDGTYSYVSVEKYSEVLKSEKVVITKDSKISDIIKDKYLKGPLKDVNIVITSDIDDVAQYRPYKIVDIDGKKVKINDNTIYINSETLNNTSLLHFAILHEFQHAVQFHNKMNLGMDACFMDTMPKTLKTKLIADVKSNMPHLFGKNVSEKEKEKIVSDYIYHSSAESMAMGVDSSKYVDFYPTMVTYSDKGTNITLPWGTTYSFTPAKNDIPMSMKKLADGIWQITDVSDIIRGNIDERISDEVFMTDGYLEVKHLQEDLLKKYPTLNNLISKWRGVPMNTYRSLNEDAKSILKEELVKTENLPVIADSIEFLRKLIAPSIPYKEFLDTDVPFLRMQQRDKLKNSAFVSVYAGATSTRSVAFCIKSFYDASSHREDALNVYMIGGTFKPRDILTYIVTNESEVLIEPSKLVGSKIINLHSLVNDGELSQSDVVVLNSIYGNLEYAYKRKDAYGTRYRVPFTGEYAVEGDYTYTNETSPGVNSYKQTPVTDSSGTVHTHYGVRDGKFLNNKIFVDIGTMDNFSSNDVKVYAAETLVDEQGVEHKHSYMTDNTNLNPYEHTNYEFVDAETGKSFTANTLSVSKLFVNNLMITDDKFSELIHKAKIVYKSNMLVYATTEDGRIITSEEVNEELGPVVPTMSLASTKKTTDTSSTSNEVLNEEKPAQKEKKPPKTEAEKETEEQAKKEASKRYVSRKDAAGTNLTYFLKKYKRVQMDPDLQEFIKLTTGETIAEELQDKIDGKHKGTLTVADVMDYLRNTDYDKLDKKTFELINKAFFKNDVIKTPEELEHYITIMPQFWAARGILRKIVPDVMSNDDVNKSLKMINTLEALSMDPEVINKFSQSPHFKTLKELTQAYKKLKERFHYGSVETKNDERILTQPLDINDKYFRWLTMSYFDGSLDSGAQIANIVRYAAKLNWHYAGEIRFASLDRKVGTGKDDKERTVGDTIEHKNALSDIVNAVESMDLTEKRKAVILYGAKYLKQHFGKTTEASITAEKMIYKLYSYPEKSLDTLLVKNIISKITGISIEQMDNMKVTAKIEEAIEKVDRPAYAVVNNIKSIVNRLNKAMNLKQRKMFVKYNSDVFDITKQGKIIIRDSLLQSFKGYSRGKYLYTDAKGLNDLWEKVRQLSYQVSQGVYETAEKRKRFAERQEAILRNLEKSNKTSTGRTKIVEKIIKVEVSSHRLEIKSDIPMPSALVDLLDFEFSKDVKTKVQEFSNEDDTHKKSSYRTFLEENAQKLEALTQNDVNEIIEFYTKSTPSEINMSESEYRLYNITQGWILAYLLRGNKLGWFTLSESQAEAVRKHIQLRASTAAQILQAQKAAMEIVNPEEIIINSLAKSAGIQFTTKEIKTLSSAIQTGNIDAINEAKSDVYNSAMQRYGKRKKSFLDKLMQWERVAMLSSPGTWIRNKFSNAIIGGLTVKGKQILPGVLASSEKVGKWTSKLVMKMFPKKFKLYEGQYNLIDTKVNDDVKNYLNKSLIESGWLKDMLGTISKYDPRTLSMLNGVDTLTKALAKEISSKLQYSTEEYKLYQFVYNRVSDNNAIINRLTLYLGKMITEKKFNYTVGFNSKFLKLLSDAYILAAQDFMHKENVIGKLEDTLFKKAPKSVYFAYKQFFPFASTSWNWFVEGLNYTPIGLVKSIINFGKLENSITKLEDARQKGDFALPASLAQYTAIRNIGKGVIGTTGFLIGCLLATFGMVSLGEEDDKYKLKCGDVYVDITDLFTTQGIFMGISIAGSIKDSLGEDSKTDFWDIFAKSIDVMFADSVFSDVYNTFRYSDSWGESLMLLPEKVISAVIPNFLKTITSVTNIYKVKYDPGVLGKLERIVATSIPGLAYAFPKYVDPYTGENQVIYKLPILTNAINKLTPLGIHPYNVSDTEMIALELGVKKSMLNGRYEVDGKSIRLTAKEIEELNMYYGELNKEELDSLLNNEKRYKVKMENGKYKELLYKDMTDKQKAAAFEQIMSKNSSYAKVYILTSKGYKYYASNSEYRNLRKLNINNVYKETGKKKGFVN